MSWGQSQQPWGNNNQTWGNNTQPWGNSNQSWNNSNQQNTQWGNNQTSNNQTWTNNSNPYGSSSSNNNGWDGISNNGWGSSSNNTTWGSQLQNQSNSSSNPYQTSDETRAKQQNWIQHKGWGQPAYNSSINTTSNTGWGQSSKPSWEQSKGWGDQAKKYSSPPSYGNSTTIQSNSKFDPYKQYMLVSGLSNDLVLEVALEGPNKNKVVLGKSGGLCTQKFRINEVNGKFQFVCSEGGYIIQVPNSSPAKGVKICINQPHNSPNEFWQLVQTKQKNGGYYIKSFCGKCLDVCQQKTIPGTPIIQYDYNGGKNQIWYFKQMI